MSIWHTVLSMLGAGQWHKINSDLKALPLWAPRIVMTITLEQVAKLAGVSLTTASRVINGLPGVRPATRERVLRVIREYDYLPNPALA
jgi:hypothetical protein